MAHRIPIALKSLNLLVCGVKLRPADVTWKNLLNFGTGVETHFWIKSVFEMGPLAVFENAGTNRVLGKLGRTPKCFWSGWVVFKLYFLAFLYWMIEFSRVYGKIGLRRFH